MTIPSFIKNPVSIIILIVFLVTFGFIVPRWYFNRQADNLKLNSPDIVIMCVSESLSTQAQPYGTIPPRLFRYSRPKSIVPVIALSYKSHIEKDEQIYILLNTHTFFGIKLGEYTYTC